MKAHAPTIILCYPADRADWWFTQGNTREARFNSSANQTEFPAMTGIGTI
jgi:hypothetical protein